MNQRERLLLKITGIVATEEPPWNERLALRIYVESRNIGFAAYQKARRRGLEIRAARAAK